MYNILVSYTNTKEIRKFKFESLITLSVIYQSVVQKITANNNLLSQEVKTRSAQSLVVFRVQITKGKGVESES